MDLLYSSTRNGEEKVTASKAILKGLADDGGLFVPESIPKLDVTIEELAKMSYQETAYAVMKLFFTDFTEEELKNCINKAYDSKFDTDEIAPLVEADGAYYLELFHGATIAFKDMALSILPHLLTTAAKKNQVNNEIVILTATSGDTGKAALAGFADVEGTKIVVFYPKDGVSPIQKQQMVTQKGDNTYVVGINGNFDQAQTGVKKMFSDKELAKELDAAGYQFSSANSINIGRFIPQITYYVYAYAKLYANGKIAKDEKINIVVPTGNFGNILSAFYAKNMGLPVAKLICASNENKVLYDFFETGKYDKNREFILTSSPSMDILISSNLERLIYWAAGNDAKKNVEFMTALTKEGVYEITPQMQEKLKDVDFDVVVGPESRGFIFGVPIAYNLHKPFVLVRKKGKLPCETVEKEYDLEYGKATIEMHKDAIKPGQKVVLVDDLIATGGTMEAAAKLVEELGGEVVKIIFLMELAGLKGRERLKEYDVESVICYEGK